MAQPTSDTIWNNQQDRLSLLEGFIQRKDAHLDDARRCLKDLLVAHADIPGAGASIGDALASLAKEPSKHTVAATILLRCLAVHGLVPEPNASNQIIRSTVDLCEGALPDILDYLRINKRTQNYEKFAILAGCHDRVLQILAPLRSPYGDLDALLSARRAIAGCLNHSIVRQYAAPFRLAELRTTIESLFSKLRKVSSLETSLLVDIDECNRAVSSVKADRRPDA